MVLMVVDDEKQIRYGLIETIDWSQYGIENVIEAENGLAALDKVSTRPVDIIIADIRMPGMNGLEMAAKVKELQPEIKIILLTGYAEFDYARKAVKLGIDEYFLKPVRISELAEKVRQLSFKILIERKNKEIIKKYDVVAAEEQASLAQGEYTDVHNCEVDIKKISGRDAEKSKWFIEKCKKYIEMNFSNDIGLEELSTYVGRNPSYISHVFKQIEGRSFSDYINWLRIQKAIELLDRSNMHIYEVAGDVGFSDYRYFINVFKKYTGLSPSEYKNKSCTSKRI
jgi:two-component system response regulator YesN